MDTAVCSRKKRNCLHFPCHSISTHFAKRRQINVFLLLYTHALLRARALLHCEIHHGRWFLCAGKMLLYMFSLLIFEQLVGTIRGMASNRVGSP